MNSTKNTYNILFDLLNSIIILINFTKNNRPRYLSLICILAFSYILSSSCTKNDNPSVIILKPLNNESYFQGDTISISVEATDKDGIIEEVRVYIDGIGVTSLRQFPYTYLWNSSDEKVGAHLIKATALDIEGGVGEDTVRFFLTKPTPIVITKEVYDTATSKIYMSGEITDQGLSLVTETGFFWAINDTLEWNKRSLDPEMSEFTSSVFVYPDSTLYFKAYAINDHGESWGNLVSVIKKIPEIENGTFTDQRDGNTYKWIKLGNQIWMAENLRYLPSVNNVNEYSDSLPRFYVWNYNGNNVDEAKQLDTYRYNGVYYNWPASIIACPSGWHLATEEDWFALNGWLDNGLGRPGDQIRSDSGWIRGDNGLDYWGFNAIPAGENDNGEFQLSGLVTYFFTPEEYELHEISYANNITLTLENGDINFFKYNRKDRGLSVRCVKDQ
ncbi:MAG: FISUMP domain-containing protein [Bacteroidales bacterium]|nr:FISUMP domain-containing protein [Bacteroidales bacterium]